MPLLNRIADIGGPRLGENTADLWSLLGNIADDDELAAIRDAEAQTLLRIIELSLLGDRVVQELVKSPGLYLGQIDEILTSRLGELFPTTDQADALIIHLRQRILGRVVQSSSKNALPNALLRDLFSDGQDLRCYICGYHFLRRDLGADRLELADEFERRFATEMLVGRLRDRWKPAARKECVLEIDHHVPEAALGPTERQNLSISCHFCNARKRISRWGLEAAWGFVPAALAELHPVGRMDWGAQAISFAAVASSGRCVRCNRTASEVELTSAFPGGGRQAEAMFGWRLEVYCYGCLEI